MALSTLVNGFLMVFIAQMSIVVCKNKAVPSKDLELMNKNAPYQVVKLLLKDYRRVIGAMELLNSDTDLCKGDSEGFCEKCARERRLSLGEKIILGVKKIGEKIEKHGEKYGIELTGMFEKLQEEANRVISQPVKTVKDVIKKAAMSGNSKVKAVSRGLTRNSKVKAVSRGLTRHRRYKRQRVQPRIFGRIRFPRIRLPRIRLPSIRLPSIRLPRLPRLRIRRFPIRFGKKKREVRGKSVEDYINDEYMEDEKPHERSVKRMTTPCRTCEGKCGKIFMQLKLLGDILNKMTAVESSVEKTTIIQNVELFGTRPFPMDFKTGKATSSGLFVTASLGGQSLTLRSRVTYSFGDDKRTLVAKGETIAKEIYARYMLPGH